MTELPKNTYFAKEFSLSAGEVTFMVEGEEAVGHFSLLSFECVGIEDGVTIAIPMGSPVGDMFFDGSVFFSLREIWEQWFEEHPAKEPESKEPEEPMPHTIIPNVQHPGIEDTDLPAFEPEGHTELPKESD